MTGFLEDRRRALEEAFYAKENRRLLDRMRLERKQQSERARLGRACGLSDEALLDALLEQGVHAEGLAAILLVPLVAVAWAGGRVEPGEREAILEAARRCGIDEDCAACALLESWLDVEPAPRLVKVWAAYTRAVAGRLRPAERERLRDDLLRRAEHVARAGGGVLGIGPKMSAAERRVLDELRSAFEESGAEPGAEEGT